MTNVDIKEFESLNIIAVDFETVPSTKEVELFSLAGYKEGKQLIAESYTPDFIPQMLDIVKNKTLVFHHAVFELEVFDKLGLDKHSIKFEDTMIMSYLLDESLPKKLKELRKIILGKSERDDYKSVNKNDLETFREYNKEDAVDTLELFAKFYPRIINEDLTTVYDLEKKTVYTVIEMENTGCKINTDLLMKQNGVLEGLMKDIEKKVHYVAGKYISLTATRDKAHLLYDIFKVNPKDKWRTKTGVSTSTDVLEEIDTLTKNRRGKEYKKLNEVVNLLLDYSRYFKLSSSFIGPSIYDKLVNGRIFSHFDALGTKTGRFSSSGINLQQIPSNPFIEGDMDTHARSLFIAEEGKVLLTADYSQIELRIMADRSQDKNLLYAYNNGLDLHQQTADLVGCDRSGGKTLNFAIGYGQGPSSLSSKLGVSYNEAANLVMNYFRSYMQLYNHINDIQKKVISNGYIKTMSGRTRRFHNELKNADEYTLSSVKRKGFNTYIQGSAADLMKLAMVLMYSNLDHSRAKIIMTVHDEITIETDIDYMEEAYHIMRYCMENALELSIPLVAEAHLGYRWSDNK